MAKKRNNKIIVFYVVAFTILTAIAAGIIGFFGFGDNTACSYPERCRYIYVDIQGNHYTLNSGSLIENNSENGQGLYKAVDGTYIAWAVTRVNETHEYINDSNNNQYYAGVNTSYEHEWRVVDESWDVNVIDIVEDTSIEDTSIEGVPSYTIAMTE